MNDNYDVTIRSIFKFCDLHRPTPKTFMRPCGMDVLAMEDPKFYVDFGKPFKNVDSIRVQFEFPELEAFGIRLYLNIDFAGKYPSDVLPVLQACVPSPSSRKEHKLSIRWEFNAMRHVEKLVNFTMDEALSYLKCCDSVVAFGQALQTAFPDPFYSVQESDRLKLLAHNELTQLVNEHVNTCPDFSCGYIHFTPNRFPHVNHVNLWPTMTVTRETKRVNLSTACRMQRRLV